MSWERDPLLAKAKLFFGRAFEFERDDPQFGLWCAFGLELLARAAISSVSLTLLAEPDDDHKHLLFALGKSNERGSGKSIGSARVFTLCKTLFKEFREEDRTACIALLNCRNDELHTGGAPFIRYPTSEWLPGFYRFCNTLAVTLGETLESVFGKNEAEVASQMLATDQNDVKQRVVSAIAAHKKVFDAKDHAERTVLQKTASEQGEKLSHHRHHRVICPACKSTGLLQGEAFGEERIHHGGSEIVVKQAVLPTTFACTPCGLRLNGSSELAAAGLSAPYTRTTKYSPEEFYGLIHPDSVDFGDLARKWLREQGPEYDND